MKKTLFFLVTLALVGFSACSDDDDNVAIPKPDFGATITLDGKGTTSAYENSVYVDFSTSTQVAVNRKSWNLGFSNGSDFRVVLNSADATTAVSSGKTDINAVTLADANAAQEIGGTAYMTAAGLPLSVVDAINGDLAGSVFAAVSANSADNLVYFVAPEDNKSSRDLWYKVKVDRSANGGYSVQYGQVGDSLITTVEVAKNAAYNLSFLSFADKKTVMVEPESKKWDIMWGFNTGLRAPDFKSTYFLQDYVAINTLAGVQAVEVLTTTSTFADYSKANISTSTFSSDKDVIGDKWRSASAYGGGTLGIKTDRFYVVKDPEGNYYKLRFLKMGLGNDGGERGRPVIEYELLN